MGSKVWRKNDRLDPLFRITVVSKCFGPDSGFGMDWDSGELSVTVVVRSIKKI